MWLSKQGKGIEPNRTVETGAVTLTGETVAVELDSERRGLPVFAPGGYHWRPKLGQQVLVLKTSEGACVVGVPSEQIKDGEVGLRGEGGAQVTLETAGRVRLGPEVEIDGILKVSGEELKTLIRRVVAEILEESGE